MYTKKELKRDRRRARLKRDSTETETGKKIARLIPHLETAKDINILIKRLTARRTAIFEKVDAAKNLAAWEKIVAGLQEGTKFYRTADQYVHHHLIRVGTRYRLVQVHKGRKHIGMYLVRDEHGKPTTSSDREIWFPAARAADLVEFSEEDSSLEGRKKLADARTGDAALARIITDHNREAKP